MSDAKKPLPDLTLPPGMEADRAKASPDETVAPHDTSQILPMASLNDGDKEFELKHDASRMLPAATIDLPAAGRDTSRVLPAATIDFTPIQPSYAETVAPTGLPPASRGRQAAAANRPQVHGYEIQKELGRGGMGVVYKARQTKLQRIVALKMVLAGAHAGEEQLARFYTEAEAVAHLKQPNIVQIYDVGEHDGLPYFSLEYVDGGCLADRIGGKPQPVGDTSRMVELLARAMAYAHENGIIHRDLKPANVLLTKSGDPKITDFGLAKKLESDCSQTKSGTLMGTPNYMAPEQARGEMREVGTLADVYALGVILYEMLTGRTPFMGASILDTLQQVRNHEPVPPTRLQPSVPRDLEVICLKCLEKEPAKRYETANLLADDLRRFSAGEPILARPVSGPERLWRWCRRNQKVAALSAAVLLLLVSMAIGGPVAAILVHEQKVLADKNAELAKEQESIAKKQTRVAEEQKTIAEANAKSASEQRSLALDSLSTLVTKVQDLLKETPATQKLKQDLLNTALEGLQKVADSADGSRLSDNMMAQAHQKMGKIFESVGKYPEARKQYESSHAIYEVLATAASDRVQSQRDLSISFDMLGNVSLLQGDKEAAHKYYSESLKVKQALAVADPENTVAQRHVGTSYINLGLVSELDEAQSLFIQALELRQKLADAATGSPRLNRLRDVRIAYNLLAENGVKQNDRDVARQYYDQALTLASQLHKAAPQSPILKMDLANSHISLGGFQLQGGEVEAAKKNYGEAVNLLRPLAKEDPEKLELQKDFVLVLARFGNHEEAAQKAEEMRLLAPDNYRNLYNVACCYSLCAAAVELDAETSELTRAEQALQKSYADKALQALLEAASFGLKGEEEVDHDPDLAAVHSHPDYPKLREALRSTPD